jgi:hypothetical protein
VGEWQVGLARDVLVFRTGDEVVDTTRFARLQHLHRDLGQIDVNAIVQNLDLPTDVERRFEQKPVVGEIHEPVGDVVVDDAAHGPERQQRPDEPGEKLLTQRLLFPRHQRGPAGISHGTLSRADIPVRESCEC